MTEMEGSYELPIGSVVDRYLIRSTLGSGSFGITYKALDNVTDGTVALKEYMPEQDARRLPDNHIVPLNPKRERRFLGGLERFEREAKLLANIARHPNIVQVYTALTNVNGTGYIVMEYIQGEELEARIERDGPLKIPEFWAVLKQIMSGVEFVHKNDLLHRDIKPSNILIDENDQAIIIDFGAARETTVSNKTLIVTDGYSPPEQYQKGQEQGPYSDIYAMAATAFFMLSGDPVPDVRVRTSVDNLPDLVEATNGKVSRELSDAIAWGLAPEASARPQSVAQWRERLTEAIEKPDETTGDPDRVIDRRLVLGGLASAVVAAGAGGAYFLGSSSGSGETSAISSTAKELVAGEMMVLGLVREDPYARASIVNGRPFIAGHIGETIGQNAGVPALTDPRIKVAEILSDGSEGTQYTGAPFKYSQALVALPDGGLIVGGTRSRDYGFASKTSHLVRLDADMQPVWERDFGEGSVTDLVLQDDLLHFALEGVNVDGKAALVRADLSGNQVGQPIELGTKVGDSVQRLVRGPDGTIGAAILRFKANGLNESIVMQLAIAEATGETTEYFVESDGLWLDELGLQSSQPYALGRVGTDFLVGGTVAYGVNENGLFGRQPYVALYSGDRRAPGEVKWRKIHKPEDGSRADFGSGRALALYETEDDLPRVYVGQFLFGEAQSRICQLDDQGEVIATTTIGGMDQPFLINDLALGPEGGVAIGMTQGQNSGALAVVPLRWA